MRRYCTVCIETDSLIELECLKSIIKYCEKTFIELHKVESPQICNNLLTIKTFSLLKYQNHFSFHSHLKIKMKLLVDSLDRVIY